MRHPSQAGAVGMQQVDIGLLNQLESVGALRLGRIAVRGYGDPLPVRRPCRPEVASRVVSDVANCPGGEIQCPNFRVPTAAGNERHRAAVGESAAWSSKEGSLVSRSSPVPSGCAR